MSRSRCRVAASSLVTCVMARCGRAARRAAAVRIASGHRPQYRASSASSSGAVWGRAMIRPARSAAAGESSGPSRTSRAPSRATRLDIWIAAGHHDQSRAGQQRPDLPGVGGVVGEHPDRTCGGQRPPQGRCFPGVGRNSRRVHAKGTQPPGAHHIGGCRAAWSERAQGGEQQPARNTAPRPGAGCARRGRSSRPRLARRSPRAGTTPEQRLRWRAARRRPPVRSGRRTGTGDGGSWRGGAGPPRLADAGGRHLG